MNSKIQKNIYQTPEIETINVEIADTIMTTSPVSISQETYEGEANARKRNFWDEQ